MAYNFPYLKDAAFLKQVDEEISKEQYVKITVLNFKEMPIQQIQGKVIGGNISLDGSSAMRRTGTINLIADESDVNLTSAKNLLSINKKIEVLIGFKNNLNKYTQYDILWFPMGIYVITAPSITHNSNGINISLTLHDKMALLNGECGGVLPASVVFNQIESTAEDGSLVITQPTIFQIIQELVHHFGGEQLGKIIISDIDNRIKKVMRWTGAGPLYLYSVMGNQGEMSHTFSTNYTELADRQAKMGGTGQIQSFYYGEDIGYIYTDFIYPGDLIANAGDTVVTVLDQIKNVLGNYEYFYDIEGNFRFQQIKNYLNTSFSTFKINEINMNNYLVDYTSGKSVYTFDNANLVSSYSNTPQFQQIKNDFMIWGKRKSIEGQEIPIRYHLAIDKKPAIGNTYQVFFYTDPNDQIEKAVKPYIYENRDSFPLKGWSGQYYMADDTKIIYRWTAEANNYVQTSYVIQPITTTDYRTQLYFNGVVNAPYGLDSNYYFTELKNEWPKIYDIRNGKFKDQTLAEPSNIDFFLDFIDTPEAISEFSVENIGRRTTVLVEDSINCLFEPDNPNIVIIQEGTDQTDDLRNECQIKNQQYSQVHSQIYALLANGGVLKSAYQEIRKELYQYTNYNEQVSISALPIYHLEPNTRITIRDPLNNIDGDYMIKSISLPLDVSGMMSLSCTKAFERI